MKNIIKAGMMVFVIFFASTASSFAASGSLNLQSTYPQDGQKNTSMENLGVKLMFDGPMKDKSTRELNSKLVHMYDSKNKEVPVLVYYNDAKEAMMVVAADTTAKGFKVANNSKYKLVIDSDLRDDASNKLGEQISVEFKTYNQKANMLVNMLMMFVMFGGILLLSMKQQKPETEENKTKEQSFNPYKEAKRTGKSVEEIIAKAEKKNARKNKKKQPDNSEENSKIQYCSEYLNNVYHVKAPAPINHADRSLSAMNQLNKAKSSKSKK